MIVIGLTGSVGMGKSTTAAMFAAEGVPVYDADAEVHRLQAPGGAAVAPIEAAFPGVVKDGAVDRAALGARVFGNPEALQRLNSIVHPLLGEGRARFFEKAEADQVDMVVLDIPLLFETGGEARVDAVVVASAPEAVQRERVLARPGYDTARLEAILARQTPDAEKRARAHFVIDTGLGLGPAREQVKAVITTLRTPGGLEAARRREARNA
ncbi:MAG: dephospho-CoA kinase [Caulobacteraceae bacterium]|nr:dephospho-CoA kinase [Caulobacteraceae bacterium]